MFGIINICYHDTSFFAKTLLIPGGFELIRSFLESAVLLHVASFTAMPALDVVPGAFLASCLSSILPSMGGIAGGLLLGFLRFLLATVGDMVTLLLAVFAKRSLSSTIGVQKGSGCIVSGIANFSNSESSSIASCTEMVFFLFRSSWVVWVNVGPALLKRC